jgi:hypothetical protein
LVTLEGTEFQWVRGTEDDPTDQCAHGRVRFEVDDATFVSPDDGLWTVTAAALHLLRTLEMDHTPSAPVTANNALIPCCGFFVIPSDGVLRCAVLGCPHGVDLEVKHDGGWVTIASVSTTARVPEEEWRQAVLAFAGRVRDFYRACLPKTPDGDQLRRDGWAALWSEWDERAAANPASSMRAPGGRKRRIR